MAKYRITSPDGGTYEITAPDTATEQEVLKYAQSNFASGGGSPSSPPPPSQTAAELEEEKTVQKLGATGYGAIKAGEAVGRAGAVGATGFNKGVAGAAGLPVDILNAGFGIVGLGSEKPVGGSRWLNENIMPAPFEARTPPEHIVGAIGEQFGMAVLPVGGSLAYVAKTGVTSAPVIKALLGDLKVMPLSQILKIEAAVNTAQGVASGATRAVTDNPYADLAAQLVAGIGMGGTLALTNMAKKHITAAGIKGKVAGALQEITPNEERFFNELAKTRNIEKGIGADNIFTTGQATNIPAVLGAETAETLGKSPIANQFADAVFTKEATANKAIGEFGKKIIPEGDILSTKGRILGQEAFETQNVHNLTNKYLNIDKQAGGQTIYDTLSKAKGKKYDEMKTLYDKIGQTNPKLDPTELKGTLETVSKPRFEGGSTESIPTDLINRIKSVIEPSEEIKELLRQPPQVLQAILKQDPKLAKRVMEEMSKEMPFNSARGFRSEIGAAIAAEKRKMNPDGNKITYLRDIGEAIQRNLDQLGNEQSELGNAYRTATSRYREEYVPFKQGVAADILQRGSRGESTRIASENIPMQFLTSGNGSITATQDFVKTMGGSVKARAALKDAAMNDVLENAVDPQTGLISSGKIFAWFKSHKDALNAFPDLKNEVLNIGKLQKHLDETVKTSLFVKGDIDKVIPSILASKNPAQETSKIVRIIKNDPKALGGFREALWQHTLDKTRTQAKDVNGLNFYDPNMLRSFRKHNKSVFEQVYTPLELKNMNTFADAYEVLGRSEASRSPDILKTEGRLMGDVAFFAGRTAGLSYYLAVSAEQTVKHLSRMFTHSQKEVLLNSALYNPSVAEAFIKMSRGAPVSSVKKVFDTAIRNIVIKGTGQTATQDIEKKRKELFQKDEENSFQDWYAEWVSKLNLNPNPDDPRHYYDYRAASKSGATPDESGHWPSEFKLLNHPNRFVNGVDTIPIKRKELLQSKGLE